MAVIPSSVVVSSFDTMAANFAQNSERVLCDIALGTGTYAIGARILGTAKFTPATALATTAALMAGLALCPSGAQQEPIFGVPPSFQGGQCSTQYRVWATLGSYSFNTCSLSVSPEGFQGVTQGPVRVVNTCEGPRFDDSGCNLKNVCFGGSNIVGANGVIAGAGGVIIGTGAGYRITRVERVDGLPDNCGSLPNEGGQFITNNNGDVIDNSKVIDKSTEIRIVPVTFNMGGVNGTLNLSFGDIRIGSLLPFQFVINIGGSDFGFEKGPDGVTKPMPTSPDPSVTKDGLRELLEKIKDCVCKPAVDLDMLFLPYVKSDETCDVQTETFLVPKGSVSQAVVNKFIDSATAASNFCSDSSVEQKPEVLIFAASTTQDGREIFSGDIGPEVKSLRFRITENRNENLRPITSYPAASQFKFGSISFVTKTVSGGGDYLYIFDTDTYYPLPKRGKEGRLRILLKAGLSFEVYDTGERYL